MTAKVVHFNNIGPVIFQKNRRSKNIRIRVNPDQSVYVSFPWYVLANQAVRFVNKNIQWIAIQQQKWKLKKPLPFTETVLQTKLHNIEIKRGEKTNAEIIGSTVQISVEDFESEKSRLFAAKIIEKIYRVEAHKLLPPRLTELAQLNDFRFNKISIRNNKRNWGSCSHSNNISLNLQMMKLTDELIDYILLHELVHTKIKNHGPEFWAKMNELTGNRAHELAKQVKRYSTNTI